MGPWHNPFLEEHGIFFEATAILILTQQKERWLEMKGGWRSDESKPNTKDMMK